MKKLVSLLTLLVLLTGPGAAQASMHVFGSSWSTEDSGSAYGGGLGIRADFLPIFGLDFRGSYLEFDNEVDAGLSVIPLEVSAIFHLPDGTIVPYAGLGCGYYLFEADRLDTDDKLGIFPVAGIELGAAKGIRFFAEGRWIMIESDLRDFESTEELAIDGLAVNAGLVWAW